MIQSLQDWGTAATELSSPAGSGDPAYSGQLQAACPHAAGVTCAITFVAVFDSVGGWLESEGDGVLAGRFKGLVARG
jgi:hypothetical protein